MTSYDLQKICRTCLVYENKLFSLNEAQAQERMCLLDSGRSTSSKTLGEMLMECTNVEFKTDDGLPQNVCLQCICTLRASVVYKSMCEESDVKLRQILSRISLEVPAKSVGIDKNNGQIAESPPIDSLIDPLGEEWFEELSLDTFENECSQNEDRFSIKDEDSGPNEPIPDNTTASAVNNDVTRISDQNESNAAEIIQSSHGDDEESTMVARAKRVNGLWPCEICKKSYADRKSHKLHVRLHFGKSLQQYHSVGHDAKLQRGVSARGTAKAQLKQSHPRTAATAKIDVFRKSHGDQCGSMRKNFNCKQCDANFESFSSLVLHTTVTHQQFDCDICGKKLATRQNLERHKQMHDKKNPNENYCGENESVGKKSHAKKFTCAICERKFSFKGNLKTHIHTHYPKMNTNNGTLCMHCGKMIKANMAIHMRRHSGEKPYKCDICGKAFIMQAYVTEHRRVHTVEKVYTCKSCGRGFNRATRYAEHMRIHGLYAENRPYSCATCDRRFSQVKYLKRHICPNTSNSVPEAQ